MKYSTFKLFAYASALLVGMLSASCSDVKKTEAYANLDTSWEKFRGDHKENVQAVFIESFASDNSSVAIIAEPPLNFDTTAFNDLMDDYNTYVAYRNLPMGVNGWVRDIVIALDKVDREDIDDLTSRLSELMYESDYKSYYLPVSNDVKPASYLSGDHNLKIPASDLKRWLIDDAEEFSSPGGNATIASLLSSGIYGVFESVKPGFIVWVLPIGDDITEKNSEIRKFALDSDLLLGSIAGDGHLAIIGREREIPIVDFPPMRTETIHLLASANKDQLSQSYERNNFFAGKLLSGKDWAPIYLSDELKNTEYGSLLNITDQMLKSWSENGQIDYNNFKYTRPDYWAFSHGAFADMGAPSLTYNWNTKGAVYSVAFDDYEIVALNRTGSLPVSYIHDSDSNDPSEDLVDTEANAYNFFSNLNNPLLMRANQYAALYQIFSAYEMTSLFTVNNSFYSYCSEQSPISEEINQILKKVIADTEDVDDRLLKVLERDSVHLSKAGISSDEIDAILFDKVLRFAIDIPKLDTLRNALSKIKEILGTEGMRKIATYAAEPRGSGAYLSDDDERALYGIASYVTTMRSLLIDLYGLEKDKMYDRYINADLNCGHRWIKTPTAVLSWSVKDSLIMTGGHNIDSRIVPIKIDRNLASGKAVVSEVNGVKTVFVAENDISKITSGFLRNIEDAPVGSIKAFRNEPMAIASRAREDVIPLADRVGRGFNKTHLEITKTELGYKVGDKTVDNCKEMIDELVAYSSQGDATGGPLALTFKKFSSDEAEVVVKSADIKLATNGRLRSGNVFQVTSHKYDFSMMTLIERENSIEIIIPAKVDIATTSFVGTTKNAKMTITNLLSASKARVKGIYQNIRPLFLREKIPGTREFYKEMQNELRKAGIRDQDILLERQDCIICELYCPLQNSFDNVTRIEAA